MTPVTITTAVKLSPKQLEGVKKALESKHGKGLEINQVVDPAVLGGVKITLGSTQLDGTVKAKFDQLRTQLLHRS